MKSCIGYSTQKEKQTMKQISIKGKMYMTKNSNPIKRDHRKIETMGKKPVRYDDVPKDRRVYDPEKGQKPNRSIGIKHNGYRRRSRRIKFARRGRRRGRKQSNHYRRRAAKCRKLSTHMSKRLFSTYPSSAQEVRAETNSHSSRSHSPCKSDEEKDDIDEILNKLIKEQTFGRVQETFTLQFCTSLKTIVYQENVTQNMIKTSKDRKASTKLCSIFFVLFPLDEEFGKRRRLFLTCAVTLCEVCQFSCKTDCVTLLWVEDD
uniref:Uncharacterized protein n=1 Tax=Romanomermis culicivorax TaxID=13658 RepID=A0A915IPA9_ROMCU